MEDTYTLLSTLVQTKSIERVLAPIAAQVSQLILVNEAYEHGDENAFPSDLLPSAVQVMKSTEGLVGAASKLAQQATDQVLQLEMPRACEALSVSGSNLITATQRVEIENFTVPARRHLIRTAKDVLEGTLKVLLVSDDAEIRKMRNAIKSTQDRLAILTAVQTIKNLVPAFKGFTEAVMLLTNLIDKRQLELSDVRQRESLLLGLSTLKKCVPMINTSLQTFVKYPQNTQAKASKMYVVGEMVDCLDTIEATIQSKQSTTEEYEEPETPGHFVTNVDKLLHVLCKEKRLFVAEVGSDLDLIIEALVRHSMAVSHLSTGQHRIGIIKIAQMLLKKRSELSDRSKMVLSHPHLAEVQSDFDETCEQVITDAQDLEGRVNGAVLQLVVDIFKETTEPLDRMIKAMITQNNDSVNIDGFVEDFHQHCDKMGQVARYTAATSLDATKVRTINNCLSVMGRVDPEIIPAIMACSNHKEDQAAIEHLRLLKTEWTRALGVLVQTIDDLIDCKIFIEVSECEMRREALRCRHSMYSDDMIIADVTRSLIGRARRVSHRATRFVDSHLDPVYRNGVMAYVKQLNKAIPVLKAAANSVLEAPGVQNLHETFHKRCDILLKCTTKIKESVLGKSAPDLLDQVRENVRPQQASDQDELLLDDKMDIALYAEGDRMPRIARSSHQAQVSAVKSYIDDVVHDELRDLSGRVVSAAIGGHTLRLELLCTTVLSVSNHLTDIANMVATSVTDPEIKRVLVESSSSVTELTPQILDKSRKVADCDTYQIDPLHTVTDSWAKQMSILESRTDAVICKWKAVSGQLWDAFTMSDQPLINAQCAYLRELTRRIQLMVDSTVPLAAFMDIVTKEKSSALQQQAVTLDDLTTKLISLADTNPSKNGDEESKREFNESVRRWAAIVYCLTAAMDRLSLEAVTTLYEPVVLDSANFTTLSTQISTITEQTLQLKADIQAAITGCGDKKQLSEAEQALVNIDKALADLTEGYAVVTGASQPTHSTQVLYAPHSIGLVLWSWAKHIETAKAMLDRWISPCTKQMDSFMHNISTYHNAKAEDDQKASELRCRRFIMSIRETFQKVRGKVLDVIQTSDDISGKNTIRRHLETWADITHDLEETAKALIDKLEAPRKSKFMKARLCWGLKCVEVDRCLQELSGIAHISIADLVQGMKSPEGRGSNIGAAVSHLHTTQPSKTSISSSMPVKSNVDQSYKKLAAAPKVHHGTPIKSDGHSSYKASPKSYSGQGVAFRPQECDKWEDGNNAIVKIAREISQQLQDMTAFTKNLGPIGSKQQMIMTAKSVAKNGEKLVKFARVLVKYSADKRVADDLRCSADYMPTVIAQLSILASVKAVAPEDRSTEKMLVKTGDNLLDAINKMLRNAEATCVKGLKPPTEAEIDETESLVLATQWHRRFQRHRLMEYSTASVDQLGLRKISSQLEAPTLTNIMKPR